MATLLSEYSLTYLRDRETEVRIHTWTYRFCFKVGLLYLLSHVCILESNAHRPLHPYSVFLILCSCLRTYAQAVRLFATPWTAERQASRSSTISWSLLKLVSTELVMLSHHLSLRVPLLHLNIEGHSGTERP